MNMPVTNKVKLSKTNKAPTTPIAPKTKIYVDKGVKFIINPYAAKGHSLKTWPIIQKKIYKTIDSFDFDFTNKEINAQQLTERALQQGYGKIVIVGGDGTINDAINGFFDKQHQPLNNGAMLGVIPCHKNSAFTRSLAIDDNLPQAIDTITNFRIQEIDVAKLTYEKVNKEGRKIDRRLFSTWVNLGMFQFLNDRIDNNSLENFTLLQFIWFAVRKSFHYKGFQIKMWLDSKDPIQFDAFGLLVANGNYGSGGMRISPNADINDGLLDIIIIRKLPRWKLLINLPKIYNGNYFKLPNVSSFKARKIRVESQQISNVSIDGHKVDIDVATYEITNQKIKIMVPKNTFQR